MKKTFFAAAALLAGIVSAAPITWHPPATFDPKKPGLGLEQLEGITITDIYMPKISKADPSDGGNGVYESPVHGTYNHHQQFVVIDNTIIVYWTNHLRDENGPGQRILAKTGRFSADGSTIDWCKDEEIVELVPPVHPAAKRPAADTCKVIKGAFVDSRISLINGRLFLKGRIQLCDGWTDNMRYHHLLNNDPVPDKHYNVSKTKTHRFDIYWRLAGFVQEWKLENGKLKPASELYLTTDPIPEKLQVTPTILKTMGAYNPLYANAKHLKFAPKEFQDALRQKPTDFQRTPKYTRKTFQIAADGKNGLSHWTEFVRPDGKWVVVRDNLLNPVTYYAAIKDKKEDFYPPAKRTNLYGTAMPVSGELPDGTVWFVGSDAKRENAYITWSQDGINFDKTKLLIHLRYKAIESSICKPPYGGAQYFQTISRGNYIWIVFSVAKEKIGVIRIPMNLLK